MIDIDEAIKVLEQSGLADCEAEADEFCEAYDYAVNTLKQKQWLIEQCQEKIDTLEQDISDCPKETMTRFILSTKLGVYKYVLELLQAEVEE